MAVEERQAPPVSLPLQTLRRADGRSLHLYGDTESINQDRVHTASASASPSSGLHLRMDSLTEEWVAVSPARNRRPSSVVDDVDDGCPFCPGGAEVPFPYEVAVFDNLFPSLHLEPPSVPGDLGKPGREVARSLGHCEVVLYTPAHEGSLATLSTRELSSLVAVWRDRSMKLWSDQRNAYVFIFENRGESVGATLSHPHGQIYAFGELPPKIARRREVMSRHREQEGTCLGCHVVDADTSVGTRELFANGSFVVAVPFAPRWPYEVHVRARRHGARRLGDLVESELVDLASTLQEVVYRYDALYQRPFSYLMAVHEAPPDADDWHLSFEFLPPDRSRDERKITASVETATGFFINDTVPEERAAELRDRVVPHTDWSRVAIPTITPLGPVSAAVEKREIGEREMEVDGDAGSKRRHQKPRGTIRHRCREVSAGVKGEAMFGSEEE